MQFEKEDLIPTQIKSKPVTKDEEELIQKDYLVEQIAKGATGMKHKASKFGEIIRSDTQ